MSLLQKKWQIKHKSIEKFLSDRLASLHTPENFYDPFLFKDMQKAVLRIEEAIKNQERIMIFGDYDVDGITGAATLINTLKSLGALVSCRLPHREKTGYGLSKEFIKEFIEKKVNLLITVDCGISCFSEVEFANENNIDVIITDHHHVPEQAPNALAILHPLVEDESYPDRYLTGAGVAFKLSQALIEKHYDPKIAKEKLDALLELAAMGTIADMGPLNNENRLIVSEGLRQMKDTSWLGLKVLKKISGIDENKKMKADDIGFTIGPRINAAGRISDPYLALFLLIQNDSEKALERAQQLEKINFQRRELTQKGTEEVEQKIESLEKLPAIIIEKSSSWHPGILGLIAGKIAEKYNRPTIIFNEKEDKFTASARSPKYFDLPEALSAFKSLLTTFGGHRQAAGLSLEPKNYGSFKKSLEIYTLGKMAGGIIEDELDIDCQIQETDLSFELLKQFAGLEPFGIQNKKPVLLIENVLAHGAQLIGRDKNHLKFQIRVKNQSFDVLAFGKANYFEQLNNERKISLAFTLNENVWQDTRRLQLQFVDLKLL
jgi:single-stranded-DNA-specific exonuclease